MDDQASYHDPDSPEVQEVFEFFSTQRIFVPQAGYQLNAGREPVPVASLAMARRLIGGKKHKAAIARESTRLYRLSNQLEYQLTLATSAAFKARGSFYRPYLPQELLDDILMISQISGDAALIAEHRVLEGKADTFFERQFALYRAGWLPCGWEGEYPEGRFKAFRPT